MIFSREFSTGVIFVFRRSSESSVIVPATWSFVDGDVVQIQMSPFGR